MAAACCGVDTDDDDDDDDTWCTLTVVLRWLLSLITADELYTVDACKRVQYIFPAGTVNKSTGLQNDFTPLNDAITLADGSLLQVGGTIAGAVSCQQKTD